MKELQVQIWSDIACPWCYVGKRRFEAALGDFEARDRVKITWRSFELDPSAPQKTDESVSYARRLAQKYGSSEAQARAMIDRMVGLAAAEDIAMDFTRIRAGNTFDAHRLLHFAAKHGRQSALKERLLRAYFCEGQAIGDGETLVQLAEDAGLDAELANAVLRSDAHASAVRADEQAARELGIHGVPFFLIGRYGISGAQRRELFAEALRVAWRELDAPAPAAADDASCGPDGCT